MHTSVASLNHIRAPGLSLTHVLLCCWLCLFAAGAAEEVGGTFDERGKVGRQFKDDGAIGGRVEKAAEKIEDKGQDMKNEAKHNA